jgi:hypothetical protein
MAAYACSLSPHTKQRNTEQELILHCMVITTAAVIQFHQSCRCTGNQVLNCSQTWQDISVVHACTHTHLHSFFQTYLVDAELLSHFWPRLPGQDALQLDIQLLLLLQGRPCCM